MRVLTRADSPFWAFAKRSAAFAAYPPDGWIVASANDVFQRLDEEWDAVFLLDCSASPLGYGDIQYARLVASHTWINTPSQYDWRTRGCSESKCLSNVRRMLGKCGSVAVYNTEQARILRQANVKQRIVLCPYSVDCAVFKPSDRPQHDRLRIGWLYNCQGVENYKGLHDILIPLIAEIGNEVEWDVHTPSQNSCLNTDTLVRWYGDLDIFLCTSSGEGGPQGPFEAAACGAIPVVTDVGQLSDWNELRSSRLIVPSYGNATEAAETVRQMAARIRELIHDRDTTEALSRYIVDNVRLKWNAETLCPSQLVEMFGQ